MLRIVQLASLVVVCSCVEVGVQRCADGTTCAAGTTCGIPSGCVAPGDCGDGLVSSPEICDDGNRRGGDGCAADCASLEQCSNGVKDDALGETCDDGNLASHDGCSSGCLTETPTWQMVAAPAELLPRINAAVAWEPDFGRAILLGGGNRAGPDVLYGDVWMWGAAGWTPAVSMPSPPPLHQHAMASDGAGEVLVFGGETGVSPCDEMTAICDVCWTWNGATWATCSGSLPPHAPNPAMAASARGTITLLDRRMTWEWSAGSWTNRPVISPISMLPKMAFDPLAPRAVVAGGNQNFTGWSWNGLTWTQDVAELARSGHAMSYDSARRRVLVFGGQLVNSASSPLFGDLRELDGEDWRTVPTAAGPKGRYGAALFYDPIRHAVVSFGGATTTAGLAETWLMRWESSTPDDTCDGTDADADGLVSCDDPDCWARCTPRCMPGTTCDAADPHCGDRVCNPYLEDAALCPIDC